MGLDSSHGYSPKFSISENDLSLSVKHMCFQDPIFELLLLFFLPIIANYKARFSTTTNSYISIIFLFPCKYQMVTGDFLNVSYAQGKYCL